MVGKMPCNVYAKNKFIGRHFTHPTWLAGVKDMFSINWLHLTDLHLGMKDQDWLWPNCKQEFFEDLEKQHKKTGPWDLVLFTGDLTQSGSSEQFKKLNKELEDLWNHLKEKCNSDPKLLVVPGNHDLELSSESDLRVKTLCRWQTNRELQNEFWKNKEKNPYLERIKEAFSNYTEWCENQDNIPKEINSGYVPGDFSYTFEKEGVKLGILGLNTAFLQLTKKNYKGRLAIHPYQFHRACKDQDSVNWLSKHHACILLTHHPAEWLDKESCQHLNSEIINSPKNFQLHLFGHMHEANLSQENKGGLVSPHMLQSRSLFGLKHLENHRERSHGYTIGQIEMEGKQGRMLFCPRAYDPVADSEIRRMQPDRKFYLPNDFQTERSELPLRYAIPPKRSETSKLSTSEKKMQLVDALLECPHMQTLSQRRDILRELPKDIFMAIGERDDNRSHVVSIVTTCLNFRGGIVELVKLLHQFDAGTKAVNDLDTVLKQLDDFII